MTTLKFTERMAGHCVRFDQNLVPTKNREFQDLVEDGYREDFEFTLTIDIKDVESFIADPNCQATASGNIVSNIFKGSCEITDGVFNLFVRPSISQDLNTAKEMHYLLHFNDSAGQPNTFYGYKNIEKEDALESWQETTTLYFYIFRGHLQKSDFNNSRPTHVGMLFISVADFLKQLASFEASDNENLFESEAFLSFIKFFSKNLWEAHAPFFFGTTAERWNDHRYPVNTTLGVLQGTKELIPIDTEDNLTISLQRFKALDSQKVVLLVHGLAVSTDIFILPEINNLVNHLHQNGFTDVWSLDWRGSSRFVYNLAPHKFTLDHVAKYDIPAAVNYIRKTLGERVEINIICHCLGSVSVMSSIAAGYTTGVSKIVSNSVSLNPKTGTIAFLKLLIGPFLFQNIFGYPYISPQMPYFSGFRFGKWIYWISRIFRWECREPSCHMLSIMWGWGYPVAYKHENMHTTTHRRLHDLFGGTSFHYYRHIRKMISRGKSVSYSDNPKEVDYFEEMKSKKDVAILLTSGAENLIFPGSNKETYHRLKDHLPKIKYFELPGYGHQDVFMGKRAHLDYYPTLVRFLKTGDHLCK
ncbi:MAG: hypothetical protein BroJett040_09880 [Oligoflexia bacterium]|nr:MAG: hypothetical protein BroJett040_09880 [Oligoflexia bacterium]